MTSIGGQTPSYDAVGDVTNDFLNSYSWDIYGRPVTVDGVGLIYDALGRVTEENNSGVYSEFVYSPTGFKMEIMNGGALVKAFAPLSGGAVRVYNADGSYYFRHADWLGSSRLASTPSRTIYHDGAYGPFGEPYAQSGTNDLSFTGMNQDTVSNVYDFPAREYGIQGRWPSPDPAGLAAVDVYDPQTWNRYSYSRNSPCSFADPTGLSPDCTFNISIKNMNLMSSQEQANALAEMRYILGLANLGVNVNNPGKPDFTIDLKNNPTGLLSFAFFGTDWDTLGKNDSWSNNSITDSATVWVNNTEMAAAGYDMGGALGRVMTHEFGHWALNTLDDYLNPNSLEKGVFAPGWSSWLNNTGATFDDPATAVLRKQCQSLHPPSTPTGGRGGGGGGGGSPGFGGDPSGNPFGSVDQGGGGYATWVCSSLVGVGSVGCSWSYHPVM